MRLALLSRAQARQGNLKSSEQTWQLALATAERQPTHLDRLLRHSQSRQTGCATGSLDHCRKGSPAHLGAKGTLSSLLV